MLPPPPGLMLVWRKQASIRSTIAQHRVGERHQVMRHGGRVSLLQVRVVGHHRPDMGLGLVEHGVDQVRHGLGEPEQARADRDAIGRRRGLPAGSARGEPPRRRGVAPAHPALAVAVDIAEHRVELDIADRRRVELEQEAEQAPPRVGGEDADLDQHDHVREVGEAHLAPEDGAVVGLELIGRPHQLGRRRLLQTGAEAEGAEAGVSAAARLLYFWPCIVHGMVAPRSSRSPRAAGCGPRWGRRRGVSLPCAWASCRHGAPVRATTMTDGA